MTTTAQHQPAESVRDGVWTAVKATVSQWLAHKDSKAGAAIAYYSIFSIGPLIVVAISIASLLFEREDVQKEVIDSMRSLIGDAGAGSIATMLNGAGNQDQGLFAVTIGTVELLYAAISVVMQLKEALNTVWEVTAFTGSGLWTFLRSTKGHRCVGRLGLGQEALLQALFVS
jgi:membrane protein